MNCYDELLYQIGVGVPGLWTLNQSKFDIRQKHV
jgi:hypothetical protein